MASASYSFIDIAVLDQVRAGFAAGDALVIVSRDLERVIWANGPGASLLGFSSIEACIDAKPGFSAAAKRQIGATSGFSDTGRERPVAVRFGSGFKSRLVALRASRLALPDGESALLLVQAAPSSGADAAQTAMTRIGGFTAEGQFAAMIGADGAVTAASGGFERLGISAETLRDLVRRVGEQPNRLIKKRIEGRGGQLPAGLARLTDDPAIHLLIVVDERQTDSSYAADAGEAGQGTADAEHTVESGATGSDIAKDTPLRHDGWYFDAPEPAPVSAELAPPADIPADAPDKGGAEHAPNLQSSPIRFVWRMDAESRFTMISEEFIASVGAVAADIIGHRFRDVADALGIDSDGEISALMERRDTWSGRTVMWPLAGSRYRVPVDLAALPAYDRDRVFQGFRGFGMLRPAEAEDDVPEARADVATGGTADDVVQDDPERVGSTAFEPNDANETDPSSGPSPSPDEESQGQPAHQSGADDKVIRLAERRSPVAESEGRAKEGGLSRTEQSAFREIANRLRRESSANRNQKPAANETGDGETSWTEPPAPERPGSPADDSRDRSGDDDANTGAGDTAPVDHGLSATPPDISDQTALRPVSGSEGDAAAEKTHERRATVTFLPSAFSGAARGNAGSDGVDQAILSHLPIPVLVHSGDALFYANAEFLRLTRYANLDALAEAGGIGALFADPPDEDGQDGHDARTLRLRNAEGLEFPVEAHLQSVRWNGGTALLLALRATGDGSDRGAEPPAPGTAELRLRLDETRAILDTATDGVVIMDSEGTIRSISRPAEALFGFDSADVAGKSFAALFAIESQRAARDYLESLSENGVASVLNDGREVIGREAQGRFIPLFMTIGRLPNASGFCAVVRDITQWKRAEEELTQARAQAEHSSSQKSEFLARVSHEIRTPLNAIIGFSELMMDEKFGPIGSDRYRDYLRDINKSGNHVLDLVNDLLDISKIEAGEQEMHYEAVSLNDTIGEAVAMMQPQANRERVIIRSSFSSRLPEVVADLRSIKQIALNLLSNAVRYTPAGGQVIVSTSYEAGGAVVMRVRDTGHGMSPEELDQALKPFKQLNTLRRTRGDGTGLGLPLTRAMVEANRARFSIKSTPGEGTLVEVTFPSTRVLAD